MSSSAQPEHVRPMSELPRDRIGLIIGAHIAQEYIVGPHRYRVMVSACPRGSTCPSFTVLFSDATGRRFIAVGTQTTFPTVDDCVAFSRGRKAP